MPCHSPPSFHLASTPAPPKPHSRLDLLKFNLALCCPRILPLRIIPGYPPLPSRTPSPRFPQLITAPFEPFAPLPDPRISLSEPTRLTATAAYPVPLPDKTANPILSQPASCISSPPGFSSASALPSASLPPSLPASGNEPPSLFETSLGFLVEIVNSISNRAPAARNHFQPGPDPNLEPARPPLVASTRRPSCPTRPAPTIPRFILLHTRFRSPLTARSGSTDVARTAPPWRRTGQQRSIPCGWEVRRRPRSRATDRLGRQSMLTTGCRSDP